MELTRMQFDVLTALLERSGMSQRALQKKTGYSLGSVNKTLHELSDAGLVDGGAVSASAPLASFAAVCASDPGAWLTASLLLLIPLFRDILRRSRARTLE